MLHAKSLQFWMTSARRTRSSDARGGWEEIDFHKLIDGFELNPSIPSIRTKSTRMWETSHRLTSTQKNLFSISINHRSVDAVKNYWRGERSKSMATTHFTFVLVVFCYMMRVCWSTWATPYGSETVVFFSSVVEVRSQSSEMFSRFFPSPRKVKILTLNQPKQRSVFRVKIAMQNYVTSSPEFTTNN